MKNRLWNKTILPVMVMLTVFLAAGQVFAEEIFLSDFFAQEHIEKTSARYSFTVGEFIDGNTSVCNTLKISYIAHSQSGSNYRKNTVILGLFRNGQLVDQNRTYAVEF